MICAGVLQPVAFAAGALSSSKQNREFAGRQASLVSLPFKIRGRKPNAKVLAVSVVPDQRLLDAVSGTTIAYAVLGLGALSFVGTFGVAPRFKAAFKEPQDWKDIYAELVSRGGVKTVTPQEAYQKAKKGAILLDVRLNNKFVANHPEGSINVPLYKPIQKFDLASNIRRAGFAFFGIYGTELNTEFGEQALDRIPKNKDVYVICEMGGTLTNKPGTSYGFQSRSLKALNELQKAGYNRVYHVKGGLIQWLADDLPMSSGDVVVAKQEPVSVLPFSRK